MNPFTSYIFVSRLEARLLSPNMDPTCLFDQLYIIIMENIRKTGS